MVDTCFKGNHQCLLFTLLTVYLSLKSFKTGNKTNATYVSYKHKFTFNIVRSQNGQMNHGFVELYCSMALSLDLLTGEYTFTYVRAFNPSFVGEGRVDTIDNPHIAYLSRVTFKRRNIHHCSNMRSHSITTIRLIQRSTDQNETHININGIILC